MSAGEVIGSPEVGISDHSDLSRFEPSCTMSAHCYDGATAFGVSAVAVPPTPLWTAPSETVISNKSFLLHVASVRYLATMTRKVNNADPDMAATSSDGSRLRDSKGCVQSPLPCAFLSPVHCDMKRVYRTSCCHQLSHPPGLLCQDGLNPSKTTNK